MADQIHTEEDEGPGLFSSLTFWVIGPVFSLLVWTGAWIGIAWLLEWVHGRV